MGRYSNRRKEGWGGSADFEFEVERYKNKSNGEYYSEADVAEYDGDSPDFELVTIELSIEGTAHYTPGYTSGLPENCYPADSDSELTKVIGPNKEDWYHKITDDERDSMLAILAEKIQDQGDDDGGDDAYDRWKDDRDSGYDY